MVVDYSNPWIYRGKPFTSDLIGDNVAFVYLITNITSGKKYIGKKTFVSTRRQKIKNKKKRAIKRAESDWKQYYGSSESLAEDVKLTGHANFQREILYLCKAKALASYLEAREQYITDCLLSADYYNTWISSKVHKTHLISQMHELRLLLKDRTIATHFSANQIPG